MYHADHYETPWGNVIVADRLMAGIIYIDQCFLARVRAEDFQCSYDFNPGQIPRSLENRNDFVRAVRLVTTDMWMYLAKQGHQEKTIGLAMAQAPDILLSKLAQFKDYWYG